MFGQRCMPFLSRPSLSAFYIRDRRLETTSSPVEDNMNETNGNSVSVLLADDSAIVRKAIKGVLQEEPSIKLLGEADCFGQAISKAVELKDLM